MTGLFINFTHYYGHYSLVTCYSSNMLPYITNKLYDQPNVNLIIKYLLTFSHLNQSYISVVFSLEFWQEQCVGEHCWPIIPTSW